MERFVQCSKNETGVVRKNWGGTPPLPISSPASQRRVGQDLRDNVRKGHTKAVPLRWFAFESRRVLGKIAKAMRLFCGSF